MSFYNSFIFSLHIYVILVLLGRLRLFLDTTYTKDPPIVALLSLMVFVSTFYFVIIYVLAPSLKFHGLIA